MPEILAPAGGMESLYAAVRSGADGVYAGGRRFSARANAVNFSDEELKEAVRYCHLHSVKLYRAMNVVIFDSETEEFAKAVEFSAEIGIDGLIIQDMGAALIASRAVPEMPLHASTQTTLHTPLGAAAARRLGFCRVVAARELTLEQTEKICAAGIDVEVFVHGAQCMCLSGQCYMSAVIGSRSANRGQCAQSCRLPFSALGNMRETGEYYALSLKDMSLCAHTDKLAAAGCASLKIEGRMKRPEYTAAAVDAVRCSLEDKGSAACAEKLRRLEAVFSRGGFTDGYLTGKTGGEMFGHRTKEDAAAAKDVLPQLASLYKNERKSGLISFEFTAKENEGSRLEYSSGDIRGIIYGSVPEKAVKRSLTKDDAVRQLSKLGGTRYSLAGISCHISEGVTLPASELNRMRREAVRRADDEQIKRNTPRYRICHRVRQEEFNCVKSCGKPEIRVRTENIKTAEAAAGICSMLIMPMRACESGKLDPRMIKMTAVSLPVMVSDEDKLLVRLRSLREKGFEHFICENLTHIGVLGQLKDIHIHGGTGLNAANSFAVKQCGMLGMEDVTVSFEIRAAAVSALKKEIPVGIYAYGRLPLMTVKNCPIKAQTGCAGCTGSVTDRTGRVFPVRCGEGYAAILNCDILETSDKQGDFSGIGFIVIDLGNEPPDKGAEIIKRYAAGGDPGGKFTRGLYYRGIY